MRPLSYLAVFLSALLSILPANAGLFGPSFEDEMEKVDACNNEINNDPTLSGIHAKLSIGRPTFDQLADETIPTAEEAELLKWRIKRKAVCRETYRKTMVEFHPWMVASLDRMFFQWDLVMVELVKRRISWGNANKLLTEADQAFDQAWNAYAKAQSDEERRQVAKALDDLGKTFQQQPTSPPGTGRVTCRWIGPTLYCDPY